MKKTYINNKFTGKINGKCASDYYSKGKNIKYGSTEDRIEKAKEILGSEIINGKEFYDEFWTNVFLQNDEEEYQGGIKLILNKDDSIYSESNIASTLELIGTAILRGDKKKENPNEYIRVFHSKEMFLKATEEYNSMKSVMESTSDGKYAIENKLEDLFVLSNQMNYKKEKRWTELDDSHLKKLNDEYGHKYPQINDYFIGYINMKNKLVKFNELKKIRNLTHEENKQCRIISNNVKSLKEDFVDCIYAKVRHILFKVPLPDGGCPDWDKYDDLDKEHIRGALCMSKGNDMQDDLSVIVKDLYNTISECEFTDIQKEVLQLLKKDKTQEDIGDILNVSQQMVNQHINAIVNKIVSKNWERYINWYYLNICRGTYKRCSECSEIKLTQYFDIDKTCKMGVKNICKVCSKNKRSR